MFVALLVALLVATPQATPVSDAEAASCDAIPAYLLAFADAAPDVTPAQYRTVTKWQNDAIFYDTARPSEAETLAAFFDEYATNLEAMPADTVPAIAEDWHDLKIRQAGMLASGYHAVASGNLFATIIYTQQETALYAEMAAEDERIVATCGDPWASWSTDV